MKKKMAPTVSQYPARQRAMYEMHFAIERFQAQLINELPMETRAALIAEIQIGASLRGESMPEGLDVLNDAELIRIYDTMPEQNAA